MAKGKRYDKEFRLGAARLVVEQGYPQAEAGRRLGVTPTTIKTWIERFRKSGELPLAGQPVPVAENPKKLPAYSSPGYISHVRLLSSNRLYCSMQVIGVSAGVSFSPATLAILPSSWFPGHPSSDAGRLCGDSQRRRHGPVLLADLQARR